jgi:hypothetical protein
MADYFLKDHTPSASQGEARLRGLWRIISSKTIRPRLHKAKPACAGYGGLFPQRPYALGYTRRSPPARALPDYVFKDHTPSASQIEARLRVTRTPTVTLSPIAYRLSPIAYCPSPIAYPSVRNAAPIRAMPSAICAGGTKLNDRRNALSPLPSA